MTPLIAVTWWQLSLSIGLFLFAVVCGALAVYAFMRGAREVSVARRLAQEATERAAYQAVMRHAEPRRGAASDGSTFHTPASRSRWEAGEEPKDVA